MSALKAHLAATNCTLMMLNKPEYDEYLASPDGRQISWPGKDGNKYDQDGICTLFHRNGLLMLRNAHGEVKLLVSKVEWFAHHHPALREFAAYVERIGVNHDVVVLAMEVLTTAETCNPLMARLVVDLSCGVDSPYLVFVVTRAEWEDSMSSSYSKFDEFVRLSGDTLISMVNTETDPVREAERLVATARAGDPARTCLFMKESGCVNVIMKAVQT